MKIARLQKLLYLSLAAALAAIAGCSGAGSSTSTGSGGGGSTPSVSNVAAISVNTGPTAGPPLNSPYVDGAFTSVTLCAPGSTTNCQTIGGILVDTGSPGLRILSSALTISLPQQTASNGSPVVECLPFVDGITWGPVQTADMTIAGEQAKSLPIQVIGSSTFSNIPSSCTSKFLRAPEDDLSDLGANGIFGSGDLAQDCGPACTVSGPSNPGLYYACPAAGCEVTAESLSNQVVNPIVLFPKDNNGVIIELPSVTGAETSISGSMIFGIGTQNKITGLETRRFIPSIRRAEISQPVFDNVTYEDARASSTAARTPSIFWIQNTTGMPTCNDATFWYCPTATQNFSATNQGTNGASGPINFSVANADTLLASETVGVANGLGGPDAGTFDWGLPFFFGRTVYTAIEGQNTPAGVGPYWAY